MQELEKSFPLETASIRSSHSDLLTSPSQLREERRSVLSPSQHSSPSQTSHSRNSITTQPTERYAFDPQRSRDNASDTGSRPADRQRSEASLSLSHSDAVGSRHRDDNRSSKESVKERRSVDGERSLKSLTSSHIQRSVHEQPSAEPLHHREPSSAGFESTGGPPSSVEAMPAPTPTAGWSRGDASTSRCKALEEEVSTAFPL